MFNGTNLIKILLASVLLFFTSQSLAAQNVLEHIHFDHVHPTLQSIETAVQKGEISREEGIVQKMYAGFKPEALNEKFRKDDDRTIRCMTPVIQEFSKERENLSAAAIQEVENLLARPASSTLNSYISPSENFIFHYETSGPDAVPTESTIEPGVPDYVIEAAFAADSSYRYQIEELGFQDFVQDEPYEVFFENISFYGFTRESGSSTTITVHNNFRDFPENTHPKSNEIGALYVTIAHEIKHASQFATNRWRGQAGNFNWSEMDATLMEEIVFDDVNDYYNYIMNRNRETNQLDQNNPNGRSIFGNSRSAIPGAYWHITWMLYFAEEHGMDFWVDVWDHIRTDYLNSDSEQGFISFLTATGLALSERNLNLSSEHLINHMWHMASGPDYSSDGYGFDERFNYPNPIFRNNLQSAPDSLTNGQLTPLAANYVNVAPSNITIGQPSVTVESSIDGIGVGVIGYFRDGTTDQQFFVNPNSSFQQIQTTWSWADLVDMSIAVVNTNRNESGNYTLTLSSVLPDEDLLAQNYPNPFNPTTQIEFSLNRDKQIRVEVFDQLGRKVSTLVDKQLNRGFHRVTFDGSGLASGVYFYRIITDQTVTTNKMMLIK